MLTGKYNVRVAASKTSGYEGNDAVVTLLQGAGTDDDIELISASDVQYAEDGQIVERYGTCFVDGATTGLAQILGTPYLIRSNIDGAAPKHISSIKMMHR